jgi:hypothetical protein
MKHVPFSAVGSPTSAPTLFREKRKKGFFALILDALHHSRRLQAERVLRQYGHLTRVDQRTDFSRPSNPEKREDAGH